MENNYNRTIDEFLNAIEADSERISRAWRNGVKENESDNIFNEVTMSNEEFVDKTITLLLGKDWNVVDSLSADQINAIAFYEIYKKYHKRSLKSIFRKLINKEKSDNNK
jgi:hypothetical protein